MSPDFKRELEAKISAYPLAAIAIALVAGAVVALGRHRPTHDAAPTKRTISSAFVGGLGALAMGVIKDAVIGHLHGAAKSWLDPDNPDAGEAAGRRDPVESFLEH